MENFNYPYISKSVTEFWRRWHMSLGQWFRDYVYIPMGGNRVGTLKHLRNIFTVWFLTGFWHGADWNFIVWGLYFAVLLTLEKMFLGKYLKKSRVLSRVYVLFLIAISFVIFNAAGMGEAMQYIGGMFGIGNYPLISTETVFYFKNYCFILLMAVIGATPIPKTVASKLKITLEDVLDIYLNNSDYINSETLLLYVIHNKPLYIFKVINLPYYRELFEELTPTEQERLYILMVQKNNKETPVRKAKR
jgi:hypothetical protein